MIKKAEDRVEREQELEDRSEPDVHAYFAFGQFMDDVGQLIMEMEIKMRDYRDEIAARDRRLEERDAIIENRDATIQQLEIALAKFKGNQDSGPPASQSSLGAGRGSISGKRRPTAQVRT